MTTKKPTPVSKFLQAPPLIKRYDFVKEYGNLIDETLLRLEKANGGLKVVRSISPDKGGSANKTEATHLTRHGITEVGRARMIDWMFEVLTAFGMSEQTFFLSVQFMDRYISKKSACLGLDQLHIIGITSMFIASKYEDITPLFMPTIVTRIGHERFPKESILRQEKEILGTLCFKLASVPTVLEFLERYLTDQYFVAYPIPGHKALKTMAKYLACLQTHHI